MSRIDLSATSRWLGPHGKRALALVGGASAAQLVPIALSPVLTRVYSPVDYGILAVFGSLVTILLAGADGRYNLAIVLPEDEEDAVQVTGLAIALAAVVGGALLLLVPVVRASLDHIDMIRDLGLLLYLVPIAVVLSSLFESLTFLSLRRDQVKAMARANVAKAVASGSVQVPLGFAGAGLLGLFSGYFVGLLAGIWRMVLPLKQSIRFSSISWSRMRVVARRYVNFPKYDLWGNLANSLTYNVVVIGVSLIYSSQASGQFALAYRFTALPSALLGVALGQVYLREAARRVHSPRSALRAFHRTAGMLALASIIPLTLVGLFGPRLFHIVFGPEWQSAGRYAAAMTPLVLTRFISSPLSSVFHIYSRQRLLLIFQVVLLFITLGTLALAATLEWALADVLLMQSLLLAIIYAVLFFTARRIVVHSAVHKVAESVPGSGV